MNCPKCKQSLRKPNEQEKNFSIFIHFSQANYFCENCRQLWLIREYKIELMAHPIVKAMEPKSLKKSKSNLKNFFN